MCADDKGKSATAILPGDHIAPGKTSAEKLPVLHIQGLHYALENEEQKCVEQLQLWVDIVKTKLSREGVVSSINVRLDMGQKELVKVRMRSYDKTYDWPVFFVFFSMDAYQIGFHPKSKPGRAMTTIIMDRILTCIRSHNKRFNQDASKAA